MSQRIRRTAFAAGVALTATRAASLLAGEQALSQLSIADPSSLPAFDVVSVKVNRSGADRQSMQQLPGGRAVITNVPLRRVILTAYELLTQQLLGGPAWFDSDRFDLEFAPGTGTAAGASAAGGESVSLFTALEEQLGLKLRPGRKAVDVLVIDRLEHPTEN